MRLSAAVALVGLAATSMLAGVRAESDVLDLTQKNFADTVKSQNLILVEFFAPWCGHCKALAPEYEIAATQLKEKNIPIAKVDCTVETDLCQEHGVSGYPTLKVFR
ncbi:protein disulfide-isomerase precursor [Entomortierella lignicola]|nr:protein disulfide-isomerase precursor [Entomortierella lignicola]